MTRRTKIIFGASLVKLGLVLLWATMINLLAHYWSWPFRFELFAAMMGGWAIGFTVPIPL